MMVTSCYAKKTMMMVTPRYAKKTMMMMSAWYAKKTMMMVTSRYAKKTMMMMSAWYAKKTMMMVTSCYAKKTMMMMSSWYAKKTMMMSLRILDPNITILGLVIIRYHLFISAFCWIRSPVIKVIFAVFVLLRTPRVNAAYQKCSLNLKCFQKFVKTGSRLLLLLV